MKLKAIIEDYLVFSKRERWGIYILSLITILVWAVPYFLSTEEPIENVFDITYVQIDSAKQLLVARQSAYQQTRSSNWKTQERFKNKEKFVAAIDQQRPVIDVNEADSAAFERLPAIGEKLSSRIVRYRERLGGFVRLDQIKEVYGITDSVFQYLLPQLKITKGFQPKKIDINKADYSTLRRHPYTDNTFIKLVLAYRKAHGDFADRTAFENVEQLDQMVVNKLAPYLSYGH
ncbi:MAG: hypothetical protein RL642_900 [Bacteroidota bacterium]